MTAFLARIRFVVGALALLAAVAAAVPAARAAADGSVNPTASSVQEEQLFKQMRRIDGRCTLPDQKACMLEQPAGRDWRQFHQVTLPWIGGIAIVGMLVALVLFYLIRGTMRIEAGRSGRTLCASTRIERFVHWMTAVCFIILALSGLNITFGKELLLPLIGPEAFTALVAMGEICPQLSQLPVHARRGADIPDVDRLRISRPRPTSSGSRRAAEWSATSIRRPVASMPGQKMIYWMVVVGGSCGGGHRLSADVPVLRHRHRGNADCADHSRHRRRAVHRRHAGPHLHGHPGRGRCVRVHGHGTVDENWAKQHHSLWLEEEKAKGNVAGGAPPPAGCSRRNSSRPTALNVVAKRPASPPGASCYTRLPCASSASPAGAVPARRHC